MKTVILMGSVYKFFNNGWKQFLDKWLAIEEMPVIDRFATLVAPSASNITDWNLEDVRNAKTELCRS